LNFQPALPKVTTVAALLFCRQFFGGLIQHEQYRRARADSLDTVELVMALEEEFECEIPDEEAEKITTVQQAVDYVNANIG